MVAGIGIDIIEIDRIKKVIDEYNYKFLTKIFTNSEIEYCNKKSNKYQHFAARFAAKEAVYKAIASGWEEGLRWKDIEIENERTGMPIVKPTGQLEKFLSDNKDLKISISHSDNYVTCVAIVFNISTNG
jgi:holo-[acyl-carrier protein] synthase